MGVSGTHGNPPPYAPAKPVGQDMAITDMMLP